MLCLNHEEFRIKTRQPLMLPQGQMEAVVLLMSAIMLLPRSITTPRGHRTSAMAAMAAAVRSTHTGCVQFGLFSHLSIYLFNREVYHVRML